MKIQREYIAILFEDDQVIDETVIDDNDAEFAMSLFKDEFGHNNLNDTAYVTIELIGFYDKVTGHEVWITEVSEVDRIDPRDELKQFKITYHDGDSFQVEARDIEEAIMHAEETYNEYEEDRKNENKI